jgi:hypothetical protein
VIRDHRALFLQKVKKTPVEAFAVHPQGILVIPLAGESPTGPATTEIIAGHFSEFHGLTQP